MPADQTCQMCPEKVRRWPMLLKDCPKNNALASKKRHCHSAIGAMDMKNANISVTQISDSNVTQTAFSQSFSQL